MRKVDFRPLPDTDGIVTGYLHDPINEMNPHRNVFPVVVVCPGGGYSMVSQREADPVALQYFAAGFQVFTLTYSVGEKAKGFTPLKELSETFCHIRKNAEDWNCAAGQIAVCGFSAGGHLAASLGVLWNHPKFLELYDNRGGENQPNAMILSYPVITADEFAHQGSIENVSGAAPGTEEYKFFSLDKHVSADTPPAFLWHTVPDDCVPIENSLSMISALQKAHISYEAHLFPQGHHGMSICTAEVGTPDPYNARWMEMSIQWLRKVFNYPV